jgi:hypothetical protein
VSVQWHIEACNHKSNANTTAVSFSGIKLSEKATAIRVCYIYTHDAKVLVI